MKLTVKNLKTLNTRDGQAFTCTLYVDGKKAALVEQGGHGGPNNYRWLQPLSDEPKVTVEGTWGVPKSVADWVAAQPPQDFHGQPLKPDLDMLVGDVIEDMQTRKRCLKHLCFRKAGAPKNGDFYQLNQPYSDKTAAWVRNKYPGCEILNETLGVGLGKEDK